MESYQKEEVRVHIRWIIRRDMPEVLAIEQESFEHPWTEEDFTRCLHQDNCVGLIAETTTRCNDRIVGFMVYELKNHWFQVLDFAVAANYRRRGVGSQMVAKLIERLSIPSRTMIALEVRETNLPAQLFYRRHGLRAVKVLKGFYEDTPEDAYRMLYSLLSYRGKQPHLDKLITPIAG